MFSKKLLMIAAVSTMVGGYASSAFALRAPEEIKSEILTVARSFQGQGDPDFSKQAKLDGLVKELLSVSPPQVRVADRLNLLTGAWKQVFGPYVFNSSRGTTRLIDADNIYQIIKPNGVYFNVARTPFLGKSLTTVFEGQYKVIGEETLSAQFVKMTLLWGAQASPQAYVGLPDKIMAGTAPNVIKIPGFLSRSVMNQKGTLKEVYTDADLRLMYGSTDDGVLKDFVYVLQRVK